MSDYDITAWLGPTAAELTDEQRDRFTDAWADVAARYPDPDDQDECDAALSAALQYLLGETSPDEAGWAVQHARAQKLAALAAARQIAVMAIADGATENALHGRLGVTRRTLRQWLGKPH